MLLSVVIQHSVLIIVLRSVSAGRLSKGGKSEVEVGEPGSWSVYREPDGRQQRFPEHIA